MFVSLPACGLDQRDAGVAVLGEDAAVLHRNLRVCTHHQSVCLATQLSRSLHPPHPPENEKGKTKKRRRKRVPKIVYKCEMGENKGDKVALRVKFWSFPQEGKGKNIER
jgi:hypothetical protein